MGFNSGFKWLKINSKNSISHRHISDTTYNPTAKNTHLISITKLSYHIRNEVLQPVEPIKYTLGGERGTEISSSLT